MEKEIKLDFIYAMQYGLAEFNDSPFIYNRIIGGNFEWINKLVKNKTIKPIFKTEDYWYLEIPTKEGIKYLSPDDWLLMYEDKSLDVVENKYFK